MHREWNEATLQEATRLLSEELQLSADAPGGMSEYRKSLVTSFFFKFYLTVSHLLLAHTLPEHLHSATHTFHRLVAGLMNKPCFSFDGGGNFPLPPKKSMAGLQDYTQWPR